MSARRSRRANVFILETLVIGKRPSVYFVNLIPFLGTLTETGSTTN